MICNLCPRNCNAYRDKDKGLGFCSMGYFPKIARSAPHFWEEPCISGTKGSGTIFFSGCTLKCVFCQNYDISTKNTGKVVDVNTLSQEIKKLEDSGVHNINLVSPTPYIPVIIEALNIYKPHIPIIYNCSGYEKTSTLKMLDGLIDIYLPDFKYADNTLALNYSNANNYVEYTTEAIKEMLRQTGSPQYNSDGIMIKGTIVRHLVLPNHTKNSKSVLDILSNIRDNGIDFPVSLMAQYLPLGKADSFEKLNRKITQREYEKVKNYLFELGFDGFLQERESADKSYIPIWDY